MNNKWDWTEDEIMNERSVKKPGINVTVDPADMEQVEFDNERCFMMGGELAFYVEVDGGVELYSNALEPWGVRVDISAPTVESVEAAAKVLLKQQRPEWFIDGEDDV